MKFISITLIIPLFVSIGLSQDSTYLQRLNSIEPWKNKLFPQQVAQLNNTYPDSLEHWENKIPYYKKWTNHYYGDSDFSSGLTYQRDSILPLQLEYLSENDIQIAITHFNIGTFYEKLNNNREAEKHYDEVIYIENKQHSPHRTTYKRFNEIGLFFYSNDADPFKAMDYFDSAKSTYLGSKTDEEFVKILRRQSYAYQEINELPKALENLLEALRLSSNSSPSLLSTLYEELGSVYRAMGKFDLAEKNIRQAIEITSMQKDVDLYDLNRQKTYLSHILKSKGLYEQAKKVLKEVEISYFDTKNNFGLKQMSGVKENFADIFYEERNYSEALKYYQSALQYISPSLKSDPFYNPMIKDDQIFNKNYLRRQLALKIRCLYALSQSEPKYYESTIDALLKYDSLNVDLLNDDWEEGSYQVLIDESRPFYLYGIKAALNLYEESRKPEDLAMAYEIASKTKSQILSRGISRKEKKNEQLGDSLLTLEQVFLDSLRSKEKIYINSLKSNDSKSQKTAFDYYFKAKLNHEGFLKDHQAIDLLVKDYSSNIPELSAIQNWLDPNTAIIEYHMEKDEVITFAITKDQIVYRTNEISTTDLLTLYGNIQAGQSPNHTDISNDLLGILDNLSSKNIDHIIIIPDKELLQIPFEQLSYKEGICLDHFEVSYEYCSGFLMDENPYTNNSQVVAFGCDYNSDFVNNTQNENKIENSFKPLQYAIEEVETSVSILGGESFLNAKANKDAFRENASKNGILHLALHGLLDERFPDQSSLIFEPNQEDYKLTASEIYDMDIPNHLTILSSCNSAAGPIKIGDGLRSMTRSFIHAGSASVIASLWESSDASTNQILEKFYTYLKNGESKSSALRKAKLEYIENASPSFKHPKYWAHLVLVGDAGGLSQSNASTMFYLLAAGLLGFLLVVALRKKAANK